MSEEKNTKKITLVIRQPEINRIFPKGLELLLEDTACVLDVIKAVDEQMKRRCEKFPVKGFKSLLHMTYHPKEERFYKQVALQAWTKSQSFVNVRENPKMRLPKDVTLVFIPEGGCVTGWEEIMDN